eukprot:TRINITY_DN3239_c0_g1_i3.p2 TRINITY_DN3239_c0_g1~~TRINITY_DN3239_c0_g1_i3.p2  ORF type:complete len:517 (+),score=110.23 TRINITY_DN3239_c0_g1_i3:76-1551(+)
MSHPQAGAVPAAGSAVAPAPQQAGGKDFGPGKGAPPPPRSPAPPQGVALSPTQTELPPFPHCRARSRSPRGAAAGPRPCSTPRAAPAPPAPPWTAPARRRRSSGSAVAFRTSCAPLCRTSCAPPSMHYGRRGAAGQGRASFGWYAEFLSGPIRQFVTREAPAMQKIKEVFRGYRARARLQRMRQFDATPPRPAAALQIQRVWRGRLGRQAAAFFRDTRDWPEQHAVYFRNLQRIEEAADQQVIKWLLERGLLDMPALRSKLHTALMFEPLDPPDAAICGAGKGSQDPARREEPPAQREGEPAAGQQLSPEAAAQPAAPLSPRSHTAADQVLDDCSSGGQRELPGGGMPRGEAPATIDDIPSGHYIAHPGAAKRAALAAESAAQAAAAAAEAAAKAAQLAAEAAEAAAAAADFDPRAGPSDCEMQQGPIAQCAPASSSSSDGLGDAHGLGVAGVGAAKMGAASSGAVHYRQAAAAAAGSTRGSWAEDNNAEK